LNPSDVLSSTVQSKELRILSPTISELGGRLGVVAKFVNPRTPDVERKKIAYLLTIKDSSFTKEVASPRYIELSLNSADAEKNSLSFQRSMQSIAYEIQQNKADLASNSKLNRFFSALAGLLVPQAHADVYLLGEMMIRLGVLIGFIFLMFALITGGPAILLVFTKQGAIATVGVMVMMAVGAALVDPDRLKRDGGWGSLFKLPWN